MRQPVRRTVEHWRPDFRPLDDWLAQKSEADWVPEYPWEPEPVMVNQRQVWPITHIDAASFERGLAYRVTPQTRT